MQSLYKKNLGIGIMILFSSIAFIICLFNFFLPSSPISYSGGAELVIVTTFTIAILSLLLYYFRHANKRWERFCLYSLILGLLLGTAFAAWLLESILLFVVMLMVLVGWFIQLFTKVSKK